MLINRKNWNEYKAQVIICFLRKKLGISQKLISKTLNISISMIEFYECGAFKISSDKLDLILQLFNKRNSNITKEVYLELQKLLISQIKQIDKNNKEIYHKMNRLQIKQLFKNIAI